VKWNPAGTKLAVASSAKLVPVLAYEAEYDWWVGKQIKTHKSTVTDLAWHPDGKILATASTDYCCRLFSAHLPEVDGESTDGGIFGDIGKLGTVLVEFNQAKSWVHAVAWSPNGNQLAFASHNCAVSFVTWDAEEGIELDSVPTPSLPNQTVTWLSDNCLVAAGHDMNPQVYSRSSADGHWHFVGYVDNKEKGTGKAKSDVSAARAMFAARVSKGQESTSSTSDKLLTKHTAAIVEIRHMAGLSASRFSTCSVDGRVVKWDVKGASKLSVGIEELQL
jgi:actin related protein 2/3 complex subunit 1A/1B